MHRTAGAACLALALMAMAVACDDHDPSSTLEAGADQTADTRSTDDSLPNAGTPEAVAQAVVQALRDADWSNLLELTRPDNRTTRQADKQLQRFKSGGGPNLGLCGEPDYYSETGSFGDVLVHAIFPEACASAHSWAGEPCENLDSIKFTMRHLSGRWYVAYFAMGSCGMVWMP